MSSAIDTEIEVGTRRAKLDKVMTLLQSTRQHARLWRSVHQVSSYCKHGRATCYVYFERPYVHMLLLHEVPDVLQNTLVKAIGSPGLQEPGVHARTGLEPRVAALRWMRHRPGLRRMPI